MPMLPQHNIGFLTKKARKSRTSPQFQDTRSFAAGPQFQLDAHPFQAGTEQSMGPKITPLALDCTGAVQLTPPAQAQLQATAARDGGRMEPRPCQAELSSCSGGEPAPRLKWRMKLSC